MLEGGRRPSMYSTTRNWMGTSLPRNFQTILPITSLYPALTRLMTNRINNDTMGKIRRGNYIFVTWIGDHAPRHVHVFRQRRLIVKFDLERKKVIEGRMSRRLLSLTQTLIDEGLL